MMSQWDSLSIFLMKFCDISFVWDTRYKKNIYLCVIDVLPVVLSNEIYYITHGVITKADLFKALLA